MADVVTGASADEGSFIDIARGVRNKEQWARYDSILIGPGARSEDAGWFDNWAQLTEAENLTLFAKDRTGANKAFCNTGEREDFAQTIYGLWGEWFAPATERSALTNTMDQWFARWWCGEIPRGTFLSVSLSGQDDILRIPATYAPAGHGVTEQRVDGAATPTLNPGTNGGALWKENWLWPIPLGIPALKKIQIQLKMEKRIFNVLRGITNAPGHTQYNVPDPAGAGFTTLTFPNRFGVRFGFLGPRYAQLRGAYSQGET